MGVRKDEVERAVEAGPVEFGFGSRVGGVGGVIFLWADLDAQEVRRPGSC